MNDEKIATPSKPTKQIVQAEEGQIEFSNFEKLGAIKRKVGEAQIEYLKKTLYSTLENREILLVLYRAHNLKLDVLSGELTAYKNKKGQLVMIVGKDAKNRLARHTGKISKLYSEAIYRKKTKEGDYVRCKPWDGGELWGAEAKLLRTDSQDEIGVTVPLSEYKGDNTIWGTKPDTMIKKVAVSQVLTLGFPELFAGIYDESEIERERSNGAPIELKKENEPPTSAQLKTIKDMGGDPKKIETFGDAARKIKELTAPDK